MASNSSMSESSFKRYPWAPAEMADAYVTEKRLDDEEWRIALRVSTETTP